jgi:hypothetical protein
MSNWVTQIKQRIRDKKCVVCGSNAPGLYNLFPLCRSDDIVLSRRIHKAESYAHTTFEAGISTAREICIDSPTPETAASFILVEYGGYRGIVKYLRPSETELLEKKFPQVIRYLHEWDSISQNLDD